MPVPTADHREADIAEFQRDRDALHALTREFDARVQARTAEAERQRDEALRACAATWSVSSPCWMKHAE